MKRIAVIIAGESLESKAVLDVLKTLGAETTLCASAVARDFEALVLVADSPNETIQDFYREEKPIGAIGEAVRAVARGLGSRGVTVALNSSEKTGAIYEDCALDDYVTDREHRVVTTPGLAGIPRALAELYEMA